MGKAQEDFAAMLRAAGHPAPWDVDPLTRAGLTDGEGKPIVVNPDLAVSIMLAVNTCAGFKAVGSI